MQPFIDAGFDLVSTQVRYSLLDSRPAGAFSCRCAGNRMKMLCYGTLAGGFLTERWLGATDPGYEFANRSLVTCRLIVDEFGGWALFQQLMTAPAAIARKHGATIGAVAARWVLDRPQVGAVIIGARTAGRLAETVSVLEPKLDREDRLAIDAVLARRCGPNGGIYELEGDRSGRHGRIMKHNLGRAQ